jgi:hypothetical protein
MPGNEEFGQVRIYRSETLLGVVAIAIAGSEALHSVATRAN